MLEMIRQGAQTTVARIFLFILAASFVLFLGDVRGCARDTGVATVGGVPISQSELDRALENELSRLSQRAGRRITQTEALQFGLDRQALQGLIGRAAIDAKSEQMGLAISQVTAAESLLRDPGFQGLDGKFDTAGFRAFLREIGMRESDFIELRRREATRLQLTDSVARAIITPEPLVKAMHDWREETRIVAFFTLDAETAVTVPEPDAAKLKETYEGAKAQFMAPEYRKLDVLLASVEDLKARIAITDDAIATAYEDTKETFATPELRRVQQIPFKDKAAAEAAKAAIKAGKNFMTVAEELKLTDRDIDLGLINKKALLDPVIAEAAFKLERNAVSDVVDGKLVTVLLRVPEIIAGKQPTLADVRDKVRETLQREKAREDVRKLRDEIEDLRTAGKSSKEIAEAKALKLIEVAASDATNKTMDGKAALDLPDAAALIASGFDTKSGLDREAVDLADGGYGWVLTQATTPTRQKPFEEVEAEVKTLYTTIERNRLMRELTQKLADRLTAGEPLDKVAAELNVKPDKTPAITRITAPTGLTETAVKQAFALPVGRGGHTDTADRKGRIVMRLVEIKPATAPTKEQLAALARELGQQIQIDTLDAFIGALQEQAGVTINEAALRRARGAAQ